MTGTMTGGWDSFHKVQSQRGQLNTGKNFAMPEDAYNKRWQFILNVKCWLTADESKLGWHKSMMTIEPEPKLIQTGATICSLCVTHGRLVRTYKLFVRTYEGKSEEDLDTKHQNTTTLQKWASLYNIILEKK